MQRRQAICAEPRSKDVLTGMPEVRGHMMALVR